ncbi:hypothetical protein BVRB_2g037220 [Beta vulgaris subsp. vulgaris]|uniref:ribulose bisphosphate carboxylase small subunit, chloroplastic 6 n=1 Tax=Beta vulgaris subsp. vulgaris TaxID=3555 RepID=UPI0005401D6E|nr:ribulose bisphosphate carboxylase small subunit, chloroplastic 6 [Beta vulgaris subsp. vulgaris]KMT17519.1 hypothetical protein BVRB_2g037220 [Beta vulgaris subsp. vulgaris]
MASSMLSNAAVATAAVSRNTGAQASMVAPFTGLKSIAAFPVTKSSNDLSSLPSNGGRVQCMQVWPPLGKKKFETLSYLPPLTTEALLGEVQYLLNKGWIPCLEFEVKDGFVYREHNNSPGYYDGRYWTMWKLPMFGCTDPAQVVNELEEVKKAYPQAFVRIIGFDKNRQVQCISFIAYKPEGY